MKRVLPSRSSVIDSTEHEAGNQTDRSRAKLQRDQNERRS